MPYIVPLASPRVFLFIVLLIVFVSFSLHCFVSICTTSQKSKRKPRSNKNVPKHSANMPGDILCRCMWHQMFRVHSRRWKFESSELNKSLVPVVLCCLFYRSVLECRVTYVNEQLQWYFGPSRKRWCVIYVGAQVFTALHHTHSFPGRFYQVNKRCNVGVQPCMSLEITGWLITLQDPWSDPSVICFSELSETSEPTTKPGAISLSGSDHSSMLWQKFKILILIANQGSRWPPIDPRVSGCIFAG